MKRSCYRLRFLSPQKRRPQIQEFTVIEKQFEILPPPPGVCQICAFDHAPGDVHNAQTLFYKFYFANRFKRSPTWRDAMAHCSDEVKANAEAYFKSLGVDIDSTNLTGDIKTIEERDRRLTQ